MQRYAGPTGTGSLCSSAYPCSLRTAVENAFSGDEIIVKPGDYSLTSTLCDPHIITIHGIAGQPRPQIAFTGAGQQGLWLTNGSTLRYVEVDQNGQGDVSALYAGASSTVDQVIARASGLGTTAVAHGGTIRNSIVVASGTGGIAVHTGTSGGSATSGYRHLTAIATCSGGVAIKVSAGLGGNATVDASNVIARGGGGGASLSVATDNGGATATLNIDHSNFGASGTVGAFAAIAKGNGNQSIVPTFVNAATGDYHQAPGSVTVGAGMEDLYSGTLDVDGQPRSIGLTTDIGADELALAPAVLTGAATAVNGQSATLGGSVNPQGTFAMDHFEYGPTAAYGAASPSVPAGSGLGAVLASANLTGLTAGTTYHYRLVATNTGGTDVGQDRTFTTSGGTTSGGTTSAGGSTPTSSTLTSAFAGVSLVSTKLRFSRRFVTVTLRCPAGTIGGCSGRTKLTARRVRLGRAAFSIAPGAQAKVKVRVTRAGRRMLGRVSKLAAKDTNAAQDRAGHSKTSAARVTIRRSR